MSPCLYSAFIALFLLQEKVFKILFFKIFGVAKLELLHCPKKQIEIMMTFINLPTEGFQQSFRTPEKSISIGK